MIYFDIVKAPIEGHHRLTVLVDNVTVDFGIVKDSSLDDMLAEFKKNLEKSIFNYATANKKFDKFKIGV